MAAAVAATTACSGWSAATTQALVAAGKAARVRAREAPAAPAPSTRSTAGARRAAALATAGPSTVAAAHEDDLLGVEPLELGGGHARDAVGPGQQHRAAEHRRRRRRRRTPSPGTRRRRGRRPGRGLPGERRPRRRDRGRVEVVAVEPPSAGGRWARRPGDRRGSARPTGSSTAWAGPMATGTRARGAQRSGVRRGERPGHGQTDPGDGHHGHAPRGPGVEVRCRHDRQTLGAPPGSDGPWQSPRPRTGIMGA